MPLVEPGVWAGLLIWLAVILVPWRPWSTKEQLQSTRLCPGEDLSDVVVLVPARNEAPVLGQSLAALAGQGAGLRIVVVDDQSTDNSAAVVAAVAAADLCIVPGKAVPPGWTGKLWALEQGKAWLNRPLTLLMDADVVLSPGLVSALKHKLREQGGGLVSLMVELSTQCFWERLLLPAFVYFFKLLYPFRLVHSRASRVAAAAGGCILIETQVIKEIGAFHAFRSAVIDDCALALRVKRSGYPIWIGLTRSALSIRSRLGLRPIWNMVTRTAFTQLHYSNGWLLVCTTLMAAAFVAPLLGLAASSPWTRAAAGLALLMMVVSYLPVLRFYKLPPYLALTLPIAGGLYLAMTWGSALRYWRGERSRWKGRTYMRSASRCEHRHDS